LGEENRKTFASPRGSVYNCAMPTDPPSGSVKEEARIRALQRTGLLDSPPEEIFDCLTRLAAKTLGVPVALLSLVDSDRQFFKSQTGLPPEWAGKRETPLSYSFCQYVVASDQPLETEIDFDHRLIGESMQYLQIARRPVARFDVNRAERAKGAAIGRHERDAGVGGDIEIADGEIVADER
jgi:GAF domain-containing protein